MSDRLCIDTNILIDFLLDRERTPRLILAIKGRNIFVSPLSIATAYYIASKDPLFDRISFYKNIENLHVLTMDGYTLERAKEIVGNNDLEDAMQVACSLQGSVGTFMTADKRLKNQYDTYLTVELVL
jgi:predicted nucleic acid-binding protein